MTMPSFQIAVTVAAIFALAGPYAAGAAQEAPSAGGSLEACFYTVSANNMIAAGLEHVLVITDPGSSGYKLDDVKYMFRNSAFTVAKGGIEASDIVGHVPEPAIKAGAQKAPLFLADCYRVKGRSM
jgi:hypothetical protein